MKLPQLSPLVAKISGSWTASQRKWCLHTRKNGKLYARLVPKGFGPADQAPSVLYMRACWNVLENAWRLLSHEQKIEWGICPPHNARRRLTAHSHFQQVNLNRFRASMPGLATPPNTFLSQKVYADHNFNAGIPPGKVIPLWLIGIKKDGDPFDPDLGDIDPPVDPVNPCWIPPEPELVCGDAYEGAFNCMCVLMQVGNPDDVPHDIQVTLQGLTPSYCSWATGWYHYVGTAHGMAWASYTHYDRDNCFVNISPDAVYPRKKWRVMIFSGPPPYAPMLTFDGTTEDFTCDLCGRPCGWAVIPGVLHEEIPYYDCTHGTAHLHIWPEPVPDWCPGTGP